MKRKKLKIKKKKKNLTGEGGELAVTTSRIVTNKNQRREWESELSRIVANGNQIIANGNR